MTGESLTPRCLGDFPSRRVSPSWVYATLLRLLWLQRSRSSTGSGSSRWEKVGSAPRAQPACVIGMLFTDSWTGSYVDHIGSIATSHLADFLQGDKRVSLSRLIRQRQHKCLLYRERKEYGKGWYITDVIEHVNSFVRNSFGIPSSSQLGLWPRLPPSFSIFTVWWEIHDKSAQRY